MKIGKSKITRYLTLLTFVMGWLIGNFTFPTVSMSMSAEHHFKFTNENNSTQIIFYHPQVEEDLVIENYHKNIVQIAKPKPKSHEHKFNLPDSEDDLIMVDNPSLKLNSERSPPLILISEVFDFLPGDIDYYFKDYKYPLGQSKSALVLKTVILLN